MPNFFKKNRRESGQNESEHTGMIGEYYEGEFPVIVRFVNETPRDEDIKRLPWFTVISWKYDGSSRNGMPPVKVNEKMLRLEDALVDKFDENLICQHAYNRTGNNLKEFNYYIADRDEFMTQFNDALKGHEQYPIEITFYEDLEWKEMKKLLEDFS